MTQADLQKCQRLYELLLGRNGRKDQLRRLTERAESFEHFRLRLIHECKDNKVLVAVVAGWRRRLADWSVETDDRKLMHDLELLTLKQVEIEKLLKASEASLIDKLRALDAGATGLVELTRSVHEVRAAIEEHRRRLADVATRSQ